MRGGGGVDGEALGVADIREMREEFEALDEFRARRVAALDAEDDHRAALAAEIFFVEFEIRIVGQTGEAHPLDLRMVFQMLRDSERVLAMPLHAERERFDSLQKHPRIVGRDARTEIAERNHAHADGKGDRAKRADVCGPTHAVVTGIGLREEREFFRIPIELSGIDDDAADGRAVAAHPLRERVDHNVRAVVQRTREVGRAEGGVHHERESVGVGDRGDGFEVGDIQAGIAHCFAEEKFGFRRDRLGEILRILRIDEIHLDAELREDVVELREGSSVEIVRGDDFITRRAEVDDRVENRARPRSQCQSGCSALEFRDALLEHIVGGIHQARVDVAEFAQAEKIRGVLGVAKHIRAGAVKRHRAGEGDGIGGGAAVEAEGFKFHGKSGSRESCGKPKA